MYALDKRGRKWEDDFWKEYDLTFGASASQIAQAHDDIDYWSDKQMENFDGKTADYIEWCHRHIEQIKTWLMYNTSKTHNRI